MKATQERKMYQAASEIAEYIGNRAYRALLAEVYTTPKPGLVDLSSNGAHRDMDVRTFEKSALALYPWFVRMTAQGVLLQCSPEDLFRDVRKSGIEAEKAMYRATGGINTHKGLIFTMGIFCAAAGRCIRESDGMLSWKELRGMQRQMVCKELAEELGTILKTTAHSHGEKNLQKYGTSGVRGEALAGYPSLFQVALPVLQQGVAEGREWNRVKLQTLLVLMSNTQDSNIISRTSPEELSRVQREISDFLEAGGAYREDAIEFLQELDQEYIRRNVSAGGCADLLAATIFLHSIVKAPL
nr:triphosphoribosyl-dephospho-CoA synthase CitG [uncultured Mediterraneibacter sp.]